MALREIKIDTDPILAKECRPVKEITPYLDDLIDDMLETMYEAEGVGLAAPQVGVLRRICVVDVGEENGTDEPLIMINPVIVKEEGEQFGAEGCLSLPGYVGDVKRPQKVWVEYQDRQMVKKTVCGEGLLARALCHEIDHLNGHMYTDFIEGALRKATDADTEEEE